MPIALDSKDLAKVDEEFRVESKVWDVLKGGAKDISEADFVGAKEVRVNKITGFQSAKYVRNGENKRSKVEITKQTLELEHEIWMGYDLDALDQQENGSYDTSLVVEQHIKHVSIPTKDTIAVERLVEHSAKMVPEVITTENSLDAFDAAEQYMTDAEITGNLVMFVSSDYYRKLKNNEKVSKTFTVNTQNINGIDRRVGMLDNEIPILEVPKARLQLFEDKVINFILVPLEVAAPIEKFNDVTIIPAEYDADGYRDKIKGLNYLDLIVFDNAKIAIYVSYEDKDGQETRSAAPRSGNTEPAQEQIDYDQMTVTQLRKELAKLGIEFDKDDTKEMLIDLLNKKG